ncbi:hypothetical protein WBP06_03555 [Novosphingobium sp. BL-8H]|uniref:hypothetical protein n=1 Tax=Novosphingobium sp. BL-8H TaxID=3127640 RepID=UPI003757DDA2
MALAPFMTNHAIVMNPLFAALGIARLFAPFRVALLKNLRFVPLQQLSWLSLSGWTTARTII